jgi:hypothetical protein
MLLGELTMKKIAKVVPHMYEDNLVLALSKDWVTLYGKYPEFDVYVDRHLRLHIVSKEVKSQ